MKKLLTVRTNKMREIRFRAKDKANNNKELGKIYHHLSDIATSPVDMVYYSIIAQKLIIGY